VCFFHCIEFFNEKIILTQKVIHFTKSTFYRLSEKASFVSRAQLVSEIHLILLSSSSDFCENKAEISIKSQLNFEMKYLFRPYQPDFGT
jgi:hypothetical protein